MSAIDGSKKKYEATVVISTLNRKDELYTAIRSTLMQTASVELIVIDDGSTDGTYESVLHDFPEARVFRSEESQGLVVQRNRAAEYASTNIIISLDDDAEFSSSDIVATILTEFDHPSVGAVFIPVIDTFRKREYYVNLPDEEIIFVTQQFAGCAYAIRVDLFQKLKGFQKYLWGWGEEEEFCIRMLNAGFFVRVGRSAPIYHHVSSNRSLEKIAFVSARNSIISTYINVPMPHFLLHFFGTSLVHIYSGLKRGFIFATIKGLLEGYIGILRGSVDRSPVTVRAYKLSRKMRKSEALPIEDAQKLLDLL